MLIPLFHTAAPACSDFTDPYQLIIHDHARNTSTRNPNPVCAPPLSFSPELLSPIPAGRQPSQSPGRPYVDRPRSTLPARDCIIAARHDQARGRRPPRPRSRPPADCHCPQCLAIVSSRVQSRGPCKCIVMVTSPSRWNGGGSPHTSR
jgi:hypothetical protein